MSAADDDLPSLEAMQDTLAFVWRRFFDQLLAVWEEAPGADLETEWGGEQVRMRYRSLPDQGDGPKDFVELTVGSDQGAFLVRGAYLTPKPDEAPAMGGMPGLAWSHAGDYEDFVAWMVPWVSLHVSEGGGWIDYP